MRVLLVVPWDQKYGGVASVVGNLSTYLQSKGENVIFLHPFGENLLKEKKTKWGFTGFDIFLREFSQENNSLRNLLAFWLFFPLAMCQLIYLIRRYQIQIVNIHYPSESSIYFAVCRWFLPIKLVISVHGADFFPNGRARVRYSRAIRFLLFSSDLVVAPSHNYLKDFLDIFPYLKGKANFIHNGVDFAELEPSSESQITTSQCRSLLCIAAHNEKKALDVLIRAFLSVKNEDPLLKLVLVGDGPLRGQLENLATDLGIRERIEFVGEKGRSEIIRLLHECEMFVLPSRAEPFGIVIIEAMACKKPVIATAVGGILEIIEDRKNGILVEPDNSVALATAIMTVLKDKRLQKSISDNGYMTIRKHFQCGNTGSLYMQVFSNLLNLEN